MAPLTRSMREKSLRKPRIRKIPSGTKRTRRPRAIPERIRPDTNVAKDSVFNASTISFDPEELRDTQAVPCPYAGKHHCGETFETHVEASHHAILSHSVTPAHTTEDGRLICPYAKLGCSELSKGARRLAKHLKSQHRGESFICTLAESCDCEKTFATIDGLTTHVRAAHQHIRWPCPMAEEMGCTTTFSRSTGATEHARNLHGGKQHPCPLANEYDCDQLFWDPKSAQSHADYKHRGLEHQCPFKQETGCFIRFLSQIEADIHANEEHEDNLFPCPLAKLYHCDQRFLRRHAAKSHIRKDHKGVLFPCPRAEELGCPSMFTERANAMAHASRLHDKLRFPCPCADTTACERVFSALGHARAHADAIHRDVKYPCPLADQFSCRLEFSFLENAQTHAKTHTHRFRCLHQECKERFVTAQDAFQHSHDPKHTLETLFQCTFPGCWSALIERRYNKRAMALHYQRHIEVGDVEAYGESAAKAVDGSLATSQRALFFSILADRGLSLSNGAEVDSGDVDDEEDPEDGIFGTDQGEEELANLGSGVLSEEHRDRIHEFNTSKWKAHNCCHVRLGSLGLKCAGPSSSRQWADEPCPHNSVIDLDTARLIGAGRRWENPRLKLACRCVPCFSERQMRCFLSSQGMNTDGQSHTCLWKGCSQPCVYKSKGCVDHVWKMTYNAYFKKGDYQPALKEFESAVQSTWVVGQNYRVVRQYMLDIAEGNRPGSDLVILDTEFSMGSRQLWEISIIERLSGNVLINTTINYPNGLEHTRVGYEHMKLASETQAATLYSSTRVTIDRMTVHQVAERLKATGIRPESLILVWHTSSTDLDILRDFLESAGYFNILPPNENCVPMIQVLRPNLPKVGGKLFPLKLEVFFPIMYPHHHLVGLNHEALIDCQQLRLVCMGLDELCKPAEERGGQWQPEKFAKSLRKPLMEWLKNKRGVRS